MKIPKIPESLRPYLRWMKRIVTALLAIIGGISTLYGLKPEIMSADQIFLSALIVSPDKVEMHVGSDGDDLNAKLVLQVSDEQIEQSPLKLAGNYPQVLELPRRAKSDNPETIKICVTYPSDIFFHQRWAIIPFKKRMELEQGRNLYEISGNLETDYQIFGKPDCHKLLANGLSPI